MGVCLPAVWGLLLIFSTGFSKVSEGFLSFRLITLKLDDSLLHTWEKIIALLQMQDCGVKQCISSIFVHTNHLGNLLNYSSDSVGLSGSLIFAFLTNSQVMLAVGSWATFWITKMYVKFWNYMDQSQNTLNGRSQAPPSLPKSLYSVLLYVKL